MNPITFLFSALAGAVFCTLIYCIAHTKSRSEKIPFYLFLLLYSGLSFYFFLGQDAHAWFLWINIPVFVLGEIFFVSHLLGEVLRPGYQSKNRLKALKKEKGELYEVIMGAHLLSQARLGALIAIQRKQSLISWGAKGIAVDALISREILYSVFTPPGALHDGGAIIENGRLAACGVIFPLTKTLDFPKELGTRHRAAVGFSETTDALCLVVSEESGTISIADRGFLYYDISFEKLPDVLDRALRFRLKNKKDKSLIQTFELAKV